jgi:hypothetical protein
MPFPIKINDHPVVPDIFSNNKWKASDYYSLCTNSEFFCCASLVTIDKQVTDSANEAFIYLLQGLIKAEEGWNEEKMNNLNPEDFASFILYIGYLETEKGRDLSIQEFWENYNGLITNMRKEKLFIMTKNGIPATEIDLEFHEERYILSVTSFANDWNNRQYFFETWTHWAFFSWGTGA